MPVSFEFKPDFKETRVAEILKDEPLGIIDIGARGGVHPLFEPLGEFAQILNFEPDAAECARLEQAARQHSPFANAAFEAVALGAVEGTAELHRLAVETNDSLRPPNAGVIERYDMQKWAEIGRQTVDLRTLDSVLFQDRKEEPSWGELIKLDTQGTEAEILRGAQRTLGERTIGIVTEVSFFELYQGQALFSELERLLRSSGFAFYGLLNATSRSQKRLDKRRTRGRERLMQADALFLKDPFPGSPAAGLAFNERQWAVLYMAALVMGYYDFALEVATSGWTADGPDPLLVQTVEDIAFQPARDSRDAVAQLEALVRAHPDEANILSGRYVDVRRNWNDVNDVTD